MRLSSCLFVKGVFSPEEIASMRAVYGRITERSWFAASPGKRAEFARYILDMYCRGMVIPEKLEAICLAAARARFSEVSIEGRRIFVVEDEYYLALEAAEDLGKMGADVIGPVGTLREALEIAGNSDVAFDAALLDIALHGETVFPVAAVLKMRRIPFAFISGYDQPTIPLSYRHTPRFPKPADWAGIASHLVATL